MRAYMKETVRSGLCGIWREMSWVCRQLVMNITASCSHYSSLFRHPYRTSGGALTVDNLVSRSRLTDMDGRIVTKNDLGLICDGKCLLAGAVKRAGGRSHFNWGRASEAGEGQQRPAKEKHQKLTGKSLEPNLKNNKQTVRCTGAATRRREIHGLYLQTRHTRAYPLRDSQTRLEINKSQRGQASLPCPLSAKFPPPIFSPPITKPDCTSCLLLSFRLSESLVVKALSGLSFFFLFAGNLFLPPSP